MEMDTHSDMERQRQGAWRQRDLCCLKHSLYTLRVTQDTTRGLSLAKG